MHIWKGKIFSNLPTHWWTGICVLQCPGLGQKVISYLGHMNWCVPGCVGHYSRFGPSVTLLIGPQMPRLESNLKGACVWSSEIEGLQSKVGPPAAIHCQNCNHVAVLYVKRLARLGDVPPISWP